MAIEIKQRGGTAAEHASFTGAAREITVDTTANTIRVHDGSTVGGYPLALADLSNVTGSLDTAVATGSSVPGSCSVEGTLFRDTTTGILYACNGSTYEAITATSTTTSGASTPGSCSTVGEIFYNTTEEKLYACNGSTYEIAVPDVPASSGASTPGSCSTVGDLFYNTTDEKLYTCNGSVYTLATADASVSVDTSTPGSCSTEGALFFNSTEQKLYVCESGSYVLAVPTSAQIEDGSLTVAAFASSIRPVELFATNPTTGNVEGRMVYNTTDNKLYRYDGSAFTAAIPTSDLTGTIGADQIAANAVTADKISANAVTAGKIAAGAISATEIAADAITTDKLAAGAVTATEIATNAVTSDKIISNAITSGKITAGAVGATQIATNAITADKIAAGEITAAKIAAGAVDATKLAANSVTADKIQAGAVTAAKIASGVISADNIEAGQNAVATGRTFGLGEGASAFTYGGTVVANTSDNTAIGMLSAGGSSYTGIATCGAVCSTAGVGGAFGNATGTSYNTWYSYGFIGNRARAGEFDFFSPAGTLSTQGLVALAGYAFYAAAGAYGPFTGEHDALLDKSVSPEPGDILCDTGFAVNKTLIDTITKVLPSSSANQKSAVGVFHQFSDSSHVPTALSTTVTNENGTVDRQLDSQYQSLIDDNNAILMASIGEGLINVCGEGGDIEVGDLIVTSNTAGKGMKQSDDIIRNYTVAKAREAVTFADPSEVKQIACIYLCG